MSAFDERSQQYVQEYIQELLNEYPEALASVVLYGSAATSHHDPGRSDINLLVVLDEFEPTQLKAISKAARRYKLSGIEPLYITRQELAGFGEHFPIEVADMKESHSVLYGDDLLRDLRVSEQALIEQLTRELLAKTIRLRFLYDEFHADKKQLDLIVRDVASPYKTLMRALLRAFDKSIQPPHEYLEVLAQLEERHGLSLEGLREAYLAKTGKTQLTGNLAAETMERVLQESEALYQYALTYGVRQS